MLAESRAFPGSYHTKLYSTTSTTNSAVAIKPTGAVASSEPISYNNNKLNESVISSQIKQQQ